MDEAILALMQEGRIRPTIVVALKRHRRSNRRRLEYGPGELGEAFTDYLVHTVLAQALENPSLSRESHVYFAGSSMGGGVLAFRLLTEYPGVFDGALPFRPPSMWETGNGLVVDAIGPWKENGRPNPSSYLYLRQRGYRIWRHSCSQELICFSRNLQPNGLWHR